MGKNVTMNYYEETSAERHFLNSATIVHLYTKPLESDCFFQNDDERKLALTYIAIASKKCGVKMLAYAIMSNHYHFLICGNKTLILEFYELFRSWMNTYYSRHGRKALMADAEPGLTVVQNCRQLRNELAYIIRNPFVARNDTHVFFDPWTSAHLYFNPLLRETGVPSSNISAYALRSIIKSRIITEIDPSIYFAEGQAQPWSFVDYKYMEQFYDNPRQYVNSVLKNVEAQVELLLSYGEAPSLSDEEMIPIVFNLARTMFKLESPSLMTADNRKQLAVALKNKYRCSNKQLARLTKLPIAEVNRLFPLCAPDRK